MQRKGQPIYETAINSYDENEDLYGGEVVRLHCQCMVELGDIEKNWHVNEFEVLTEKEYAILCRYHEETCQEK